MLSAVATWFDFSGVHEFIVIYCEKFSVPIDRQRVQNEAARLVAGTGTRDHKSLHHSTPPEPTLASDKVPHYIQALHAHAPGANWSQPCAPVGHDDIRR